MSMAMSDVERQRKRRENNRCKDMVRISFWIQNDANQALQNLSRHLDKRKPELIRELLLKAQGKVLNKIHGDDEAWDQYWGVDRGMDQNEETGVNEGTVV
jgi:hypothetical protein